MTNIQNEIEQMKSAIDQEAELARPTEDMLRPLYESILLMQKRYEARIKEVEKSASERDAFYSDMQKIRAEHHLAEKIQRGMLPDIMLEYLEQYGIDIYADMDTAWEIGGDYYDFFMMDETKLFFCIGDVSGKSVPAAMLSMVAKTIMEIYMRDDGELSEICQRISKQLYFAQHTDDRMFVTAWFGILDTKSGMLQYVNAGHEAPLYIHHTGETEFLKNKSGLPIASYFNKKRPEKNIYQSFVLKMEKGDSLLLYTDGITDTENSSGERFGRDRIEEISHASKAHEMSMEDWVKYLQRHVIAHADHGKRDDDITVLGIKYIGDK